MIMPVRLWALTEQGDQFKKQLHNSTHVAVVILQSDFEQPLYTVYKIQNVKVFHSKTSSFVNQMSCWLCLFLLSTNPGSFLNFAFELQPEKLYLTLSNPSACAIWMCASLLPFLKWSTCQSLCVRLLIKILYFLECGLVKLAARSNLPDVTQSGGRFALKSIPNKYLESCDHVVLIGCWVGMKKI